MARGPHWLRMAITTGVFCFLPPPEAVKEGPDFPTKQMNNEDGSDRLGWGVINNNGVTWTCPELSPLVGKRPWQTHPVPTPCPWRQPRCLTELSRCGGDGKMAPQRGVGVKIKHVSRPFKSLAGFSNWISNGPHSRN